MRWFPGVGLSGLILLTPEEERLVITFFPLLRGFLCVAAADFTVCVAVGSSVGGGEATVRSITTTEPSLSPGGWTESGRLLVCWGSRSRRPWGGCCADRFRFWFGFGLLVIL
jgi:hypothetical protein